MQAIKTIIAVRQVEVFFLLLLVLFCGTGCSNNQPSSSNPQSSSNSKDFDTPEVRAAVQQSAFDYGRKNYPKSSITGVWVAPLSSLDAGYFGAIDIAQGPGHKVVNVNIRQFVTSDKKTYWLADKLTPIMGVIYGGVSSPSTDISSTDSDQSGTGGQGNDN